MAASLKKQIAVAVVLMGFAGIRAHAYEFRVRFVERVGSEDFPLAGNAIDASNLEPRRIRVQFGVFDDDNGAAPAGGFLGWNFGSITVGGGADNSDEYRNSVAGVPNGVGRLAPFAFAPANQGANGLPAVDPFDGLTRVDNTLGQQALPWLCGCDGRPKPAPQPAIRGLNTYVSTYELTIDPREGATSYTVALAGNLLAATDWLMVGDPVPPSDPCDPNDPNDPTPGSATYAPLAAPPSAFSSSLLVVVPSPSSAMAVVLIPLIVRRRRSS